MYSSKNMLYILSMLEAIEKICLYAEGFEDEEVFYSANRQLNFNACVNLLIACGEENKKIAPGLKHTEAVNWKNISAMRDKLSHDYRGIDESIVWNIIQEYLPTLKEALIEMIPYVESYDIYLQEALQSDHYTELKYLQSLLKEEH